MVADEGEVAVGELLRPLIRGRRPDDQDVVRVADTRQRTQFECLVEAELDDVDADPKGQYRDHDQDVGRAPAEHAHGDADVAEHESQPRSTEREWDANIAITAHTIRLPSPAPASYCTKRGPCPGLFVCGNGHPGFGRSRPHLIGGRSADRRASSRVHVITIARMSPGRIAYFTQAHEHGSNRPRKPPGPRHA